MQTKSELIIDTLKTGKTFSLSDLTESISESTGQTVKRTDISSIVTKLTKPERNEIGYFIQRRKKPKSPYKYKLVNEALEMTTRELKDLARKSGKNRFTIEDAMEKYPGLRKYVKPSMKRDSKTEKSEPQESKEKTQVDPSTTGTGEKNEISENDLLQMVRQFLRKGLKINVNVNVYFT